MVLCLEWAFFSEINTTGAGLGQSQGQETQTNPTEKKWLHLHSSPRPRQSCLMLFGFASSCELDVFIASLIQLLCVCVSSFSSYYLGCHLLSQPPSFPSGRQCAAGCCLTQPWPAPCLRGCAELLVLRAGRSVPATSHALASHPPAIGCGWGPSERLEPSSMLIRLVSLLLWIHFYSFYLFNTTPGWLTFLLPYKHVPYRHVRFNTWTFHQMFR